MRNVARALAVIAFLGQGHVSWAQDNPFDSLTVRLAKTPDAKDANKPAILGYQRDDGGKTDYVTQGAIKANRDFCENNACTLSPSASWNHNSVATSPTDNWSLGLDLKRRWVVNPAIDALVLSGGLSRQRDATKSSNSGVTK